MTLFVLLSCSIAIYVAVCYSMLQCVAKDMTLFVLLSCSIAIETRFGAALLRGQVLP